MPVLRRELRGARVEHPLVGGALLVVRGSDDDPLLIDSVPEGRGRDANGVRGATGELVERENLVLLEAGVRTRGRAAR